MRFNTATVNKAYAELRKRRETAEAEAKARKDAFIKEHPEFEEIEAKLSEIGLDAVAAAFGNGEQSVIDSIKKDSLEFQKTRKAFLKANGLDENYLEPQYTCPKCKDTGVFNNRVCSCFEEILNSISVGELASKTPLKLSSFDDFNVELYGDITAKRKMTEIFEYCKTYADDFDTDSPSLYMYGETGLGKTHLSLAIAQTAIKKGFNVIYGSAHDLFGMIENERFKRSENSDGVTAGKLIECDLLILDDLGAEFITPFTVTELYSIIDSRLAKELPTIISSNLGIGEIEKTYNKRIASRILYSYYRLDFAGNDIRQINDINNG